MDEETEMNTTPQQSHTNADLHQGRKDKMRPLRRSRHGKKAPRAGRAEWMASVGFVIALMLLGALISDIANTCIVAAFGFQTTGAWELLSQSGDTPSEMHTTFVLVASGALALAISILGALVSFAGHRRKNAVLASTGFLLVSVGAGLRMPEMYALMHIPTALVIALLLAALASPRGFKKVYHTACSQQGLGYIFFAPVLTFFVYLMFAVIAAKAFPDSAASLGGSFTPIALVGVEAILGMTVLIMRDIYRLILGERTYENIIRHATDIYMDMTCLFIARAIKGLLVANENKQLRETYARAGQGQLDWSSWIPKRRASQDAQPADGSQTDASEPILSVYDEYPDLMEAGSCMRDTGLIGMAVDVTGLAKPIETPHQASAMSRKPCIGTPIMPPSKKHDDASPKTLPDDGIHTALPKEPVAQASASHEDAEAMQ